MMEPPRIDHDAPKAGILACAPAELRAQADEYDELASGYHALADELRYRAKALTDPGADTGSLAAAALAELDCDPPPRPPLTPQGREQLLAAWPPFLAMLTARRAGIDPDGAALLEDADPRHALWVSVGAVATLLGAMDPAVAQSIVEHWALNVAGASNG